MITQFTRKFEFSASHQLQFAGEKCKNMHGHNYKCQVTIRDEVNDEGYICCLEELKENIGYLLNAFDHGNLNDLFYEEAITQEPTCEAIAVYFYESLKHQGYDSLAVSVAETDKNSAYAGDF